MGLAVAPPVRHDIGARNDDDYLVPVRWLRADGVTAVVITSAVVTLRFDLPGDDTWPLDPGTGVPIPPVRQVHTITSTTPGAPGGWLVTSRYAQGEVLAYLAHGLWAAYVAPHAGTWDLVAVSTESVQRCLVRGEFVMEKVV